MSDERGTQGRDAAVAASSDDVAEDAATGTAAGASAPDVAPEADDAGGAPEATAPGDAEAPAAEAYATFVPVRVASLVYELPAPSPVLHLREDDLPLRGILFPIGLPEAQSIAYVLEGERAPRPSTHDLLAAALVAAGCDVVAVRLTGVRGGTIHAELDLAGPRGRQVLDCRPSDGIAIALRMPVPAPILADEKLLE